MERSDRIIENVLKHYKLGLWNVANQKGFTNYDKKTYDDDALLNAFQDNKDTYELSLNTDVEETFIIDTDNGITEDQDVDEEINYEGRDYDFSHLGEDFYDGEDGVYSDDDYDDI